MLDEIGTRKMNLVFAKLNCDVGLFTSNIHDALNKIQHALLDNNGKQFSINENEWAFADNASIYLENHLCIAGRLGRKKAQKNPELDEDQGRFFYEFTKHWTYSNYILDFETEKMLIEERKNKLSFKQFSEAFIKMLLNTAPELGDIYLNPILNKEKIWEQIDNLLYLNRVAFKVRLPNFDQEPEYKDILNDLNELGAKQADHVYKNDRGSLKKDSPRLRAVVSLSAASYGSFSFDGKKKDGTKTKIISEKNVIMKTNEIYEDSPSKFATGFFNILKEGNK